MKVNGNIQPREVTEYDSAADPIINYLVEHTEAVRVIKASNGRAIFIRANGFAPSKNQEGVVAGHTHGRDVMVSVRVTKPAALHHLAWDYSERTRNECFVKLTVSNRCIWLG